MAGLSSSFLSSLNSWKSSIQDALGISDKKSSFQTEQRDPFTQEDDIPDIFFVLERDNGTTLNVDAARFVCTNIITLVALTCYD